MPQLRAARIKGSTVYSNCHLIIGADYAGTTGNFASVLTEKPGANIMFCPGNFQGPILISEVKVQ